MHADLIATTKEIISRDDVLALIGYGKDRTGFRVSPLLVRTAGDAEQLVFSPLCALSLVNYLTLEKGILPPLAGSGPAKKIAVMVRGCDSRALAQLIAERGLRREDLIVIGLPCRGVVDLRKLEARFPGTKAAGELTEAEGHYLIKMNGEEQKVPREDLLAAPCRHCAFPNPVIADVVVGEPVASSEAAYPDVEALESRSRDERARYWKEAFSQCLRCYACRNVCPLCYCDGCVLERLSPQWVYRSVEFPDNMVFHLSRAYHLAGRCAGCGECERACPVNLPLMTLNRKLEKDVREFFAYTAGVDGHQKPLLCSFDPNDSGSFIL